MQQIRLVGLPTKRFLEIEQIVHSFIESNELNEIVVRENKINILLESAITSIPAVIYSDTVIFIHPEQNIESQLEGLFEELYINNIKGDKCNNCGKCKCKLSDSNDVVVSIPLTIQHNTKQFHKA